MFGNLTSMMVTCCQIQIISELLATRSTASTIMPEALTPLQSSGVGEEPGPATMYTSTSESRSATASRSRQRSLSFDDVIAPVGDEQKNQLDLQQQATTSSSNTAEDMAADTNQWTAEKEARLQFVQRKLHEANKRWSAEQEKWLGEVRYTSLSPRFIDAGLPLSSNAMLDSRFRCSWDSVSGGRERGVMYLKKIF